MSAQKILNKLDSFPAHIAQTQTVAVKGDEHTFRADSIVQNDAQRSASTRKYSIVNQMGADFGENFRLDNIGKRNANRISIEIWDLFRAIIMFLIYLFAAYNLLARYDFLKPFNFSRIESVLIQWTMASFAIIAIITICMDLINRNLLWKIISTFNSFDEQVPYLFLPTKI